jgi:alpha-glucoside transport system substrate-binding protein
MKKALLGVILLLAGALAGCASTGPVVSVIAIWTGEEGARFQRILDAFTAKTGIMVDYQGTRAVDQVLASDVAKGTPPDIAILSRPNDLARYQRAGDLQPLDEVTGPAREAADHQPWQRKDEGNRLYTVGVKTDKKSRIWYRSPRPPQPVPRTWGELTSLGGARWCLGVSSLSTTGWPGTDWVEDILLHQNDPGVYQQWVAGTLPWESEPVRRAWQTWGSAVIGSSPGITALLTDFSDATRQDCGLVRPAAAPRPGFVELPFPELVPGGPKVSEVAGDSAGRFTTKPAARDLIRYLATEGQRIDPPDLFVSGSSCFSAADLMPPAMTTAFYRSALEYLADPASLDTLLTRLDKVRVGIGHEEWLTVGCGSAR